MIDQLLNFRIDGWAFLLALDLVGALVGAALLVLLFRRPARSDASRRGQRRAERNTVVILVAGALTGWLLAWLAGDVLDVFGVSFSTPTRVWTAVLCAGFALAVTGVTVLRGWQRAVAILALPLCLLVTAAGINAEVGQFPTVRAALGIPVYGTLASGATVRPPARGSVGSVTIPGAASGFAARPALVYLPPAALTAHPPVLPVIEAFSGQPGSPQDVFVAGQLAPILDSWASSHGGVAPIVVVPDQLGAPEKNPMCLDSPLGNSATYLTVDVPNWIRTHFKVRTGPEGWAVAGFSQGGTCAIQLGASHPRLYGTVFDISGELEPRNGTVAHTVAAAFGGSTAAYDAAMPSAILAAHAPYAGLNAIFAVGASDGRYRQWARQLTDAAGKAGAAVRLIESPGTGHDWHTVRYAWTTSLPLLAHDLGLTAQ
ncbi:alpha/beta hydrolase [Glaciibacter sp. 2TAF33]|uniref:alpha/beta hydrolase n=1 Tax=Glaciibacter sp. 2TAF33 TaxID=3233015 RepID=UPI003F8F3AFE